MALQISCPVCRGDDTRLLFSKDKYDFVECRKDKLVYVNPQPDFSSLKERYDAYAREYYVQPEYTADEAGLSGYRKRFLLYRKTNRLLEVGASAGNFLVSCRDDGWEVSGVELGGPSSRYAREHRGLNVVTGTIHDAGFPADSFDVVAAWATLEHVPDPREVIGEIFRVLRPGGLFVLSVPNWGGISFRLLGPKHRYVVSDHLFYFSPKNAASLLGDIGFRNVRTSSLDFNPFIFWQDWRGHMAQVLHANEDAQRPSESLAQKRSEQATSRFFSKLLPRPLLSWGYRALSRTMGTLRLGNILFAEGVK